MYIRIGSAAVKIAAVKGYGGHVYECENNQAARGRQAKPGCMGVWWGVLTCSRGELICCCIYVFVCWLLLYIYMDFGYVRCYAYDRIFFAMCLLR